MILVDTNVWSELTKPNPDRHVVNWEIANSRKLFLSSVVLAELRAGVALMAPSHRQTALQHTMDRLVELHGDRILNFDEGASVHYAQILLRTKKMGRPIATADAMIAATALRHDMALATRDQGDFAGTGARLINPWKAPSP
jgi:predicted nucleic acid-binding protein